MAVLGSEHSETVLVRAGDVIPLSWVNLYIIIYNKPFLTIWWIFKFFSFCKKGIRNNACRHYLWISWLWFGMWCIYEETWHTAVWVTLSESTTISPCVLAVCPSAPPTPAPLSMLHLLQVCAPFLGCQGIFDGAKKKKEFGGKDNILSWHSTVQYHQVM